MVVPLLGKYLVFTITMVSISICLTIFILNIHYRTPELYKPMSDSTKNIFLIYLPKLLFMKTIDEEETTESELKRLSLLTSSYDSMKKLSSIYEKTSSFFKNSYDLHHQLKQTELDKKKVATVKKKKIKLSRPLKKLITENIFYLNEIINFMENDFNAKKIIQQWRLLAFVLDRVVFLLFGSAFLIGTFYIFLQAPSLYYTRVLSDNYICVLSEDE